jgi:hypothetical protein
MTLTNPLAYYGYKLLTAETIHSPGAKVKKSNFVVKAVIIFLIVCNDQIYKILNSTACDN